MALRISASTQHVGRTASLPQASPLTMCGWAKFTSDRNDFSSICALTQSPRTNGQVCLQTGADGTTVNLWYDSTSIGVQEPSTGFSITVGTPFFWAVVVEGTGANQMKAYFRNRGSNTFDTSFTATTGLGANYTPVLMRFGNADTSEWMDGPLWNIKVWERALTSKELLTESFYRSVMFPTSVHLQWLLNNLADTYDYTGQGKTATVTGAATTEPSVGNYGLWTPRRNIYVFKATATGQSVSVGLNSETDTAFALTHSKSKALGLTSETDSVLALAHTKSKAVGLNSETDSVLALTRSKSRAVGLTSETDSAFSIVHTKSKAVGLNSETDTALAAAAQRNYPVGLTSETDSAFSIAHKKIKEVGLTIENDTAQAVTTADVTAVSVELATETDTAFSLSWIKVKAVGLNTESDSAQAVSHSKSRAVGLTSETDSALAAAHLRSFLVGLASSTATALPVTFFKQRGVGLALEQDSALPIEQPDKLLDPSAYFPVSVAGQGPQLFTVAGEGPNHAKLFNV